MKSRRVNPCPDRARRGIVLLVVVALLALFTAVGLAFFYYADAQAAAARTFREAQGETRPDMEPELLLALFLEQLLFDTTDEAPGIRSALRGHSLLRSTYGANYALRPDGTAEGQNNTVAYNGTGRLHAPSVFAARPGAPPQARDDFFLVNYTYFQRDGFLRDPERLGARPGPGGPPGPFTGGFNAPYTYADLNNMFLEAVRADGTILMPSFHRPWAGFGSLDPSNWRWYGDVDPADPTRTPQPWLKYFVLRPRPADHPPMNGRPGFRPPESAGGDVQNLVGWSGDNDSIWLDLGAPTLTAPDGRKYTVLFAPLVLDLDGRVNVNVHGNVRGTGSAHASNQGWGPWEVSLARALRAGGGEWANLFRGARGLRALGRYGPDGQPSSATPAVFGPAPPFYARVDYDGRRRDGGPTGPLQLPLATACFPTYPAGFGNAALAEREHHPQLFRALGPPARLGPADFDRRFPASDLELLLRLHDCGSPALTSDLARLCPQTFSDVRTRRLVTTDSWDLDRPGVMPWMWGTAAYAAAVRGPQYPLTPERLLGGGAKPFPSDRNASAPPYCEFDPQDWRSLGAALGRVDLDRPLPDYPAPDASGRIGDADGFLAAQAARQDLARDIFQRLVKVVGVYDPDTYLSETLSVQHAPPSPPELHTLRWLAQLAVNMVDYLDRDDYATPFNWGRTTGTPAFAAAYGGEWVFGTELPRVLINEVYAEYLNAPGETGKKKRATKYLVNVWVELHNPLRADPALRDGGSARLDGGYELVLSKPNSRLWSQTFHDNPRGDPDGTGPRQTYSARQVYTALRGFAPAVLPTADRPGGGFYVVGPVSPVPGVRPSTLGITPTLRCPEMSYQVRLKRGQVLPPPNPTVLLRRLACPDLPWQPDPGAPLYNPFVTVDFLESVPLQRGISNTGAGYLKKPTPPAERYSVGRMQPYDGHPGGAVPQKPAPPLVRRPQHTFFQHNTPRAARFDWLVHLDRRLVSPLELLHASACAPHLLTHMFRTPHAAPYVSFHHAPYWLLRDGQSPLYRAFEMLSAGPHPAGVESGGRLPGKINLNSVWDAEVLEALCDAQPSSYFDDEDVRRIFAWMLASRSPGGAPGPDDRPFKGLGVAHFVQGGELYAPGGGLEDTVLRSNPAHPWYDAARRPIRLFEVVKQNEGGALLDHPYRRYELLTKIFNQVTTRSHVFAVWVTAGFFEVNDDTTYPRKLGAEIGRSENRHIRHRMFAVVDRSAAVPILPEDGAAPLTSALPVPGPGLAEVTPSRMHSRGPGGGAYVWSIQPGMVLHVTGPDGAGNPVGEDVVVRTVTATAFTASFTRAYPSGLTSIRAYGNPGPRRGFRPRDYPALVPYFSVIR